MIVLSIRSAEPDAQIFLHEGEQELSSISWHADRELSDSLHKKITDILQEQDLRLNDIEAINVFKGPGSFTGLRISITVANTFADALKIPIVGEMGDDWVNQGIQRLLEKQNDELVLPEYGGEPNITKQKK